jgi:uncharacterized membrane protein
MNRMWVQAITVMAVAVVLAGAVFGVVVWVRDSGTPSALVQSKQMERFGNAWVYYFILNGVNQRVTYTAWNAAQPGTSYASYSSSSRTTPVEDEEATDPDITETDTQYSIPETSVDDAAADDTVSDGE